MKVGDLVFNQQQSWEVLVYESGVYIYGVWNVHRTFQTTMRVLNTQEPTWRHCGFIPGFIIASVLGEVTRLPEINLIWISFFLSLLFLMCCSSSTSSRWLVQVLHTGTGRMQHKASVLSVPPRGQRTAGKRHKQFNLSGRKVKAIDWSKGEWTRHISAFGVPPIFASRFSHFPQGCWLLCSHTRIHSQVSVRAGIS